MPCYYTGSAEGDAQLAAKEAREELGKTITELNRYLCAACHVLEINGWPFPRGLDKWWKKHKKIDAKRKKRGGSDRG